MCEQIMCFAETQAYGDHFPLHYREEAPPYTNELSKRQGAACAYLPVHSVDCWEALWVNMHSDECMLINVYILGCPLWMTHLTLQTQHQR